MRRFIRHAVLLPVLLLLLGARQEASVVDKIVDEGRNRSEVMAHLDHLVNKIGPRLTSSDRLTRACSWARHTFESWGLKNCRLEQWGTFPVGFNRGPWSGKMTAPEVMDLTCATMSWTPGTKGPVEGMAVLGPSTDEELQSVEPRLKGAWVLSPGTATSKELNEKILAAYDKAGIAGLIRRGTGELIHTQSYTRVSWDKLPTRVNIVLLRAHFDRVKELLGESKAVRLRFDIQNEFIKGPIPLYNVIAEIPGTEKPEEMVIVGGHIDSWDGATGTTDNGTGTCTTLESARLLMKAGAKPKRTIRFMLWSGEEQGLLGSQAYIRNHPEENAKISAVLVHDGGTNYVSGILATKPMVPLFEKVFEPVLKLDPEMPFNIVERAGLPRGIGSDHDSYLGAGVPGFFWSQAGKANYGHTHHTQFDTYDMAVEEYQKHTSMVVAIGALGIANLDELLPRDGLVASGGGGRRGSPRMLGVNTEDDGITIADVVEKTAAERAELKAGDKILKVGDKEVKDNPSLREAIRDAPHKTVVRVRRGDKELEFKVTFDRTLGVESQDDGITISDVGDNTPASKAGLKPGDKFVKFDGKEVKDLESLRAAMREGPKKAKFVVLRAGKEVELEVEFER
jgi:hypothetical protein